MPPMRGGLSMVRPLCWPVLGPYQPYDGMPGKTGYWPRTGP